VSRTGRRPGAPETRATILASARRGFGARGYDATSLRSIAEEAGVDPALLVHYFGNKEGLFAAALGVTVRPSELFAGLETAEVGEAVEAIVRRYVVMLDVDQTRDALLSLVRSAVSNERAAAMLREFLTEEILTVMSALIDCPDARLRASLAAAQLVGIAMLRHVVRVEPLAAASSDEIVALAAPVVERYFR
jgi:AcrR family transcriptional regulator